MSARPRAAYAVLPDPRRPLDLREVGSLDDAHALGGRDGLLVVLREISRLQVTGRASSSGEVALLREWIETIAQEEADRWLDRHTRRDPILADRSPSGMSGPGTPEVERASTTCSRCGAPFEAPAPRPGRPRTRCFVCSPARS